MLRCTITREEIDTLYYNIMEIENNQLKEENKILRENIKKLEQNLSDIKTFTKGLIDGINARIKD